MGEEYRQVISLSSGGFFFFKFWLHAHITWEYYSTIFIIGQNTCAFSKVIQIEISKGTSVRHWLLVHSNDQRQWSSWLQPIWVIYWIEYTIGGSRSTFYPILTDGVTPQPLYDLWNICSTKGFSDKSPTLHTKSPFHYVLSRNIDVGYFFWQKYLVWVNIM